MDEDNPTPEGKIPLYQVETENIDVGMTPDLPNICIIHLRHGPGPTDVLALGLDHTATNALVAGLQLLLQLQAGLGEEEPQETPIPKNKLN